MAIGKIPARLPLFSHARAIYEKATSLIPAPRADPNIFSALSIVSSIVFLVLFERVGNSARAAVLALVLFFDFLDGLVARKRKIASETGYKIDVFSDRISEALVTLPLFFPWFLISSLNSLVCILGIWKGKHIVFPLRFFLFVFLALS